MKNPVPGKAGQISLLVEILDWLLAPLIVLWPVSVVVTFWTANAISNIPYDKALGDAVTALARRVSFDGTSAGISLPEAMSSFLRTDEIDLVYFQVRGTRGEVLAGDGEPAEIFPAEDQRQNIVYFREVEWQDEPVRVAYMFLYAPEAPHRRVLIQVGETLKKRQKLSNEIVAGIIIPQFYLFPFAALLVWLGLQRGTLPLERLRRRLTQRRPGDLSPINVEEVPEEIDPLVRAFNDLLERLGQAMRAQEQFIADAAHQMRTPLAGLRTQLEFALRQRDPREIRESLERIHAGVERTARVISQLLSLARSQAEAPAPFETRDMDAEVREVTRDWVARALERRIDLGFEGAGESAWVECNALMVRELLNNLIDNALRYTPPGGRVTSRVRINDWVIVEIEDNGIGIDESARERIFERFYRVAGTETSGSGLGLSIVRSVAEQHGAEVSVRPNPVERGSVFSVKFPRASRSQPRQRAA